MEKDIYMCGEKWLTAPDEQDAKKKKDDLYLKQIYHSEWDTCSPWLHSVRRKAGLEYVGAIVRRERGDQFSSRCTEALRASSWRFPLSVGDSDSIQLELCLFSRFEKTAYDSLTDNSNFSSGQQGLWKQTSGNSVVKN